MRYRCISLKFLLSKMYSAKNMRREEKYHKRKEKKRVQKMAQWGAFFGVARVVKQLVERGMQHAQGSWGIELRCEGKDSWGSRRRGGLILNYPFRKFLVKCRGFVMTATILKSSWRLVTAGGRSQSVSAVPHSHFASHQCLFALVAISRLWAWHRHFGLNVSQLSPSVGEWDLPKLDRSGSCGPAECSVGSNEPVKCSHAGTLCRVTLPTVWWCELWLTWNQFSVTIRGFRFCLPY